MDKFKQYDSVELKDGRTGAIVEILGEQEMFMIDIGSSPEDWETITVERKDILKKI